MAESIRFAEVVFTTDYGILLDEPDEVPLTAHRLASLRSQRDGFEGTRYGRIVSDGRTDLALRAAQGDGP